MPEFPAEVEVPSRAAVVRLTAVLDRALRILGDRVDDDLAARLAAEAWWSLESEFPQSAERVNRTMHDLTARMSRKRRAEFREGRNDADGPTGQGRDPVPRL